MDRNKVLEDDLYGAIKYIQDAICIYTIEEGNIEKDKPGGVLKGWLWIVFYTFVKEFDKIEKPNGDMCLFQLKELGLIFFAWYFRVHLSKLYDARRPIKQRKKTLKQMKEAKSLMLNILDFEFNKKDHKLFKLEKFDESIYHDNT